MRATRTDANAGPYSDEAMDAPEAAGVTVSETALTVTEEDTTGDSYTVVLDSQPTANVVVTVAGHSGTDVLPAPTTLTFTTMNWETAQTVSVTAVNDADTTNETVSLTHSAASTDTDYDGITIDGVTVMVEDNDTAKVTGVVLTPGDEELVVAWVPVPNATGYEVQWKSGGQGYNNSDRQATVASGSTASHTIPSLTNGTTYTVRVRATRTDANAGPYSDEAMDAPEAAGVTVSETALTVTEEDTTGDSYTVVLDSQPTANVVVTVAGHSGTDVLPAPTTLTFTSMNWETAQTVTVTAVNDANTVDETVSLTHAATSTDTDYDGITIAGVTVMVEDNDTAKVTGVVLTPGDEELVVAWAPVPNATGYEVQWKSGGQGYNNSDRQATVASGSTASHTIPSLTNGTTYTVRVRATRTDANAGPYSDEAMDAPEAAGVTVSETALTVTEEDTTGDSYTVVLDSQPTANVVVTVAGHSGTDVLPAPTTLTFTSMNWETAQTVSVTAVNDADTVDETVSLTHAATSTDTDYDGITIAGVTVMVEDNDTAQVTGVVLTPGDGELVVAWAPVANATGYEVQWKSGGQSYNNSGRQATISSGSTASHTIPSLTNGTTYTVRVRATRTDANAGPYSDEAMDAPEAAAVPPVTLSIADASAFENAGHLLFEVTLSRSLPNTVKVDFETISGGTATEGVDYHARRTYTHVIPGRETTVQMGFALIEDTDNDAGETVKVRLSNARVVDAYGNVKMVLNITNAEATGTITAPATTTTNVPGLTIGIQDATGDEDDGWLDFRVRLSRKSDDLVCYDFETISGGTAEEGTDYLKIPKASYWMHIGKRVDTLFVRIIDDSVNDNGETVKVKISNARLCDDASQTVSITRDEATGTIRNTDPMPQGFLGRFGRTAAVEIIAQVEERIRARRTPGMSARLAGRELRSGMTDDVSRGFLRQLGGLARSKAPVEEGNNSMAGFPGGAVSLRTTGRTGVTPIGVDPHREPTGPNWIGYLKRGFGVGDLLTGSSFELNRETGHGGKLSFWSRGARSQFTGREDRVTLDGRTATTMAGADFRMGRLVAGLSLAHSRGQGDYKGVGVGALASSVTGLYPWLGYQATERITVWGVTGFGKGSLRLTPGTGGALETGLSMAMAAAGMRGELVAPVMGGFGMAFKTDALWVATSNAGLEGPAGSLAATRAVVTRFRAALEASRGYDFRSGLSLQPSMEVGLRQDDGNAETGAGVDVAGGLIFSVPSRGIEADLRVRTLLMHQDQDYRERGVLVSFSYDPTPSTPLGMTVRLAPSWGGQARSAAEALWSRETMEGLGGRRQEAGARFDTEIAYGLPVGGRMVGIPLIGIRTSTTSRYYQLGYKLAVLQRGAMNFELGVAAQHRESLVRGTVDRGMTARVTMTW